MIRTAYYSRFEYWCWRSGIEAQSWCLWRHFPQYWSVKRASGLKMIDYWTKASESPLWPSMGWEQAQFQACFKPWQPALLLSLREADETSAISYCLIKSCHFDFLECCYWLAAMWSGMAHLHHRSCLRQRKAALTSRSGCPNESLRLANLCCQRVDWHCSHCAMIESYRADRAGTGCSSSD